MKKVILKILKKETFSIVFIIYIIAYSILLLNILPHWLLLLNVFLLLCNFGYFLYKIQLSTIDNNTERLTKKIKKRRNKIKKGFENLIIEIKNEKETN